MPPSRLILVRQLWFPVNPVTGGRREAEVVAMKLTFIEKIYCSVSNALRMTVYCSAVVWWFRGYRSPHISEFDAIHLWL